VAVLLEEVVLHLPDVVDAQPVRERALLERLLEEPVFGIGVPGTRELVLVEHAELHARVAPDHGPGIRPGVLRGIHPASGFRTGSKLVTRSAACSKPIRTSTGGSARGGWWGRRGRCSGCAARSRGRAAGERRDGGPGRSRGC